MKHIDIQVKNSFEISGSLNIPIVENTGSIPTGINSGSIFFNKEDNNMYIASASQYHLVGAQALPPPPVEVEYLVVAGGGAGGYNAGGGGGAGGLLSSSISPVESGSSFTITIGAGGAVNTGGSGSNGVDSSIAGASISTITATAGGGGGGREPSEYAGVSGGSGGGSSSDSTGFEGGAGTVGQGNDGGGSTGDALPGSGGGAGAAGATSGNGGDGLQSNITGTATYYAGGGGIGYSVAITNGGQGGGGTGINATDASAASTRAGGVNTGGGGAGGYNSSGKKNGGQGGSGVVILAYDSGSINGAGGIVGDAGNGRKYHKFNSSGTFYIGSTSDFQIVTDGLQLHWDPSNTDSYPGTGTTIYDLTGNGYNGTLINSPTYTTSNGYGVLETDGSTSYITVSTPNLSTSNYTVMVGSRYTTTTASNTNNSRLLNAVGNNWLLGHWYYTVDKHYAEGWVTDSGYGDATDTTWRIYTGTGNYSGDQYSFYINNSINVSNSSAGSQGPSGFAFGRAGYYDGEYAPGQLSFLLVYNKILTSEEMTQNYNVLKARIGQ